jgi:hypothetical protein
LDELSAYKKKCNSLEHRLAEMIARDLYENPPQLPGFIGKIITYSWKEEEDQLIMKIMKNLLKKEKAGAVSRCGRVPGKKQEQ